MPGKYSVNQSTEVKSAKGLTNDESDIANLNQRINEPPASIRPVGRIGTLTVPILLTLLHSSTTFAMDPQAIAEVTEEIIERIEKCPNEEVHQATASEIQNTLSKGQGEISLISPASSLLSSNVDFSESHFSSNSGNGIVSFLVRSVETTTKTSADTKAKAIDADANGKTELAAKYRTAVERLDSAVVSYEKAIQTYTVEKKDESNSWNNVGGAASMAAEALIKAIEARECGNVSLGEEYERVIEKSERSVEFSKQAVQSFCIGKRNEGISWHNAGSSTQSSAEVMLKAIEARKNGNAPLGEEYERAAARFEQAAELGKQAAAIIASGKEEEGEHVHNAGYCTQSSAERIMKAIEADQSGNMALAKKYRQVAEQSAEAAKFIEKSAQACASETKRKEAISWRQAGKYTQLGVESRLKAFDAETNGNLEERNRQLQVAVTLARAAKLMKQSAEAYATKNRTEGSRLYREAEVAKATADELESL
ncbi:MAG: hypothetical protein A3F67_10790 [Verrucomicrobia bacterium RIFCSPHIGHO2_12_FULL_41_10]|nr:MAG: hypothetical protein A3F67_10790 [Verrucomicrobia bacterium RIFCSPHIGHO2_12_FULL_41_10]